MLSVLTGTKVFLILQYIFWIVICSDFFEHRCCSFINRLIVLKIRKLKKKSNNIKKIKKSSTLIDMCKLQRNFSRKNLFFFHFTLYVNIIETNQVNIHTKVMLQFLCATFNVFIYKKKKSRLHPYLHAFIKEFVK